MELPVEENRGRLSYWLFYAQRCVAYAYAEVLRAHCEERAKPYVITPPQWGALELLLAQDGMTIGAMSQKRGVDAPAATGIITRLEQMGLVERRHDREDRRVVKVYLTAETSHTRWFPRWSASSTTSHRGSLRASWIVSCSNSNSS